MPCHLRSYSRAHPYPSAIPDNFRPSLHDCTIGTVRHKLLRNIRLVRNIRWRIPRRSCREGHCNGRSSRVHWCNCYNPGRIRPRHYTHGSVRQNTVLPRRFHGICSCRHRGIRQSRRWCIRRRRRRRHRCSWIRCCYCCYCCSSWNWCCRSFVPAALRCRADRTD